MQRTGLASLAITVCLGLTACGSNATLSPPGASAKATEVPDYSSADLSQLVPTPEELSTRMVSGWKVRESTKSTYQGIGLLGLDEETSAPPSTSECRKLASAGAQRRWIDGQNVAGTNPSGNDFGIALLRFKAPADASAYVEGAKIVTLTCLKESELDPSIAADFPWENPQSKIDGAFSVIGASQSERLGYALLPHGNLVILVTTSDTPGAESQVDALLKLELDKLANPKPS